MRHLLIIYATFFLIACSPSIEKQMNLAEKEFIKEVSTMTEKDALSKGIDYYKAPEITTRRHIKSLTGKDLIKICNDVINSNKEDENMLKNGQVLFIKTHNVSDIKEFALNHPDKIVGNEYEFSGVFTHYGKSKYGQRSATVVIIPQINRYILLNQKWN